jgi:hypothetical protein
LLQWPVAHPTGCSGCFPAGVVIERTGLAEAVAAVKQFLDETVTPA